MNKPRILVTGATGKTGSETARELLKRGFPVRALVHREDARSNRLKQGGAEIFVGNMYSIDDMISATKNVQRAYFVCPWTTNQLDLSLNFAVAAAENQVQHVVAISQWLSSPSHVSIATRRTWLIDQVMTWLPNSTLTLINVGFFADNYMALLETVSQLGLLPMPLGNGANAPVSNGDIGRCSAAALADPDNHGGKTYRPCGPELLSPTQIADTFARVLNRKVTYQNISEKMFLKATRSMGIPIGLSSQLRHYFAEYRDGTFAEGAPNDAVKFLTGREPEDFETIVRSYVEYGKQPNGMQLTGFLPSVNQVPSTHKTARNKIRALVNFGRLLFTKAPNVDHYEREQFPVISNARMAHEHQPWSQTHCVTNAFGSKTSGPKPDERKAGLMTTSGPSPSPVVK